MQKYMACQNKQQNKLKQQQNHHNYLQLPGFKFSHKTAAFSECVLAWSATHYGCHIGCTWHVMAEFEDRQHRGHLLGVWGSMTLAYRNPVTIVSEYPISGKVNFLEANDILWVLCF